jgi:hypothetical protein
MPRQASRRVYWLSFIDCISTHRLALSALLVTFLASAGTSCREPGAPQGVGARELEGAGSEPDRGGIE